MLCVCNAMWRARVNVLGHQGNQKVSILHHSDGKTGVQSKSVRSWGSDVSTGRNRDFSKQGH